MPESAVTEMVDCEQPMRGLMMIESRRGRGIGRGFGRRRNLDGRPRQVADEKAVFATVESISVVPARGRIGGIVVQLNVREGDAVTGGQAIAAIGDEKLALQMKSLDAQIEALKAQSDQAQIDLTGPRDWSIAASFRASSWTKPARRSTSPKTGCARRTAERAVIQQQFNEGQVLAPADGRVLKKLVTIGSVVLPGDAVAMIAQQNFKLRLRVPERHARFLKAGDKFGSMAPSSTTRPRNPA